MGHFSSWYFWLVDLPCSVVPAIIAARRRCESASLIYVLSLFLGWTIVGGAVALIWALKGKVLPPDPQPKAL
jgi:hypothetical protein